MGTTKESEEQEMTYRDKQDLLHLIDSLTKRQGSSQYDYGNPIIDETGIRILKDYIKNKTFED